MKVVLTGGGTAGHVNPALGIADIIKSFEPDSTFEYIGTENHIESKLVPKAGYNIKFINVMGLKRSISPENIKALSMTLKAIKKCKAYLKEIKPDVVIGTGGYVCYPVCYAASSLGIPVVLHEANAEPGFAIKMLRNKVDIVFVNFNETAGFFNNSKCKIIHSGMPVKKEFSEYTVESARSVLSLSDKKRIISFGGSIGSKTINDAVLDFAKNYLTNHPDVCLIHAAGSRFYNDMSNASVEMGLDKLDNFDLMEYIYDMPVQMAASDIIICRSGATTVSEISALGKASILVPSPNVTNNQQYKNAKILSDRNAAVLIEDKYFNGKTLVENVDNLLNHDDLRNQMANNSGLLYVSDTGNIIYNEIKRIINS